MKIKPKAPWYVDPGISVPTSPHSNLCLPYCVNCDVLWLVEGALVCPDCNGTIPPVDINTYPTLSPEQTLVSHFHVPEHKLVGCPLAGPLHAQQLVFSSEFALPHISSSGQRGYTLSSPKATCATCGERAQRQSIQLRTYLVRDERGPGFDPEINEYVIAPEAPALSCKYCRYLAGAVPPYYCLRRRPGSVVHNEVNPLCITQKTYPSWCPILGTVDEDQT